MNTTREKPPYGILALIFLLLAGATWLSSRKYRSVIDDMTDAGAP